MKLNGRKLNKADYEVCVIPRRDGDLVFKAKPILDFEPFNKLCPMPIPPSITLPGGATSQDVEDTNYRAQADTWAENRTDWIIIQSLSATEGLTWDGVNPSDPNTWKNFRSEFETSGLTNIEVNAVIAIVIEACGLNNKKIEEATKRFLAGQAAAHAKP